MQTKTASEMHPQLRPYARIVEALAAILGDDCEIILHDTNQLEHSIVACANEHITGRTLGAPMSAYGWELLSSDKFSNPGSSYTYMARANNGALIKCGVIALRDDAGQIIGLLCLHFDTAKAQVAREWIEKNFLLPGTVAQTEPINEFFGLELEEVFKNALHETRTSWDTSLSNMTKTEKMTVIRSLIEKGFFMMKGAVDYVASEMGNSKFTIYAYMREIERTNDHEPIKERKESKRVKKIKKV